MLRLEMFTLAKVAPGSIETLYFLLKMVEISYTIKNLLKRHKPTFI